ncbi:MAG: cell shape determination protein CcmA [Candidatus Cloacimonadota bacterium]|nr:MAG: cell shape determination protein CcmA [Candidatus Cloacimonadota bacterium]
MARNRKVELTTILGKGSRIKGDLFVDGGVRIDGDIEGKVESTGFVTIGVSGVANADVKAEECLVSGKVVGNITVSDGLELDSTANLSGNIVAKIIKIHTGAIFNGVSQMTSGESEQYSRIVKPSVKQNTSELDLSTD